MADTTDNETEEALKEQSRRTGETVFLGYDKDGMARYYNAKGFGF